MFVFDAEKGPHATAADFRKGDEEAEECRVLEFRGVDGVEDPIEAKDRVKDHGEVVDPRAFVTENLTEERMLRVRIAEACSCQQAGSKPVKIVLLQSIARSQIAARVISSSLLRGGFSSQQ